MEALQKQIAEMQQQIQRLSTPTKLYELEGMIETVTVIPTKLPTSFQQQVKIYVDSITAPTDKRLYIYSNKTHSWYYSTLS